MTGIALAFVAICALAAGWSWSAVRKARARLSDAPVVPSRSNVRVFPPTQQTAYLRDLLPRDETIMTDQVRRERLHALYEFQTLKQLREAENKRRLS